MLSAPGGRRLVGFTLIELMIALTLVGIGLALATPSMSAMLQNSKLGSAARSYYTGLQTARSEAIRRNQHVEFVLTATPVNISDIANVAVLNASGPNWLVRVPVPSVAATYALVETRSAREGAHSSTGVGSVSIAGNPVAPATTFDGSIAFDGLGAIVGENAYDLDISNPAGGDCALARGPMRCLRIRVTPGGQMQLCDPAVPASALGDSRRCL